MSNERFSDDLLSAIIDGEADEESVASVTSDPVASQRLADLRTVVEIVGEEPTPASGERRQQSIAAALAAAKPATGVTSLTAEREARRSVPVAKILTIAAAVLLLVLFIPLVANLRSSGSDAVDVAADAAEDAVDAVEDRSLGSVTADDEEAMEDDEGADGDAMEDDDEAMEDDEDDGDEAMEDDEDDGDEAMEDDEGDNEGEFVPASPPTLAERLSTDPSSVPSANSLDDIDDLVAGVSVFGEYGLDDLRNAGINPQCLVDFDESVRFSVVQLDTDDSDSQRLVIVAFEGNSITSVFDAEDCVVLR